MRTVAELRNNPIDFEQAIKIIKGYGAGDKKIAERMAIEAMKKQIALEVKLDDAEEYYLCPSCGVKTDSDFKFCDQCGQKLDFGWE